MSNPYRSRDIYNLLDLQTPLSTHHQEVIERVFGLGPLEPEAQPRQPLHVSTCLCADCMTAGQRFADYLRAKRLEF
jgi:hypothetical protein